MKNFCSITLLAFAIFALATKDAEAQRFTNKKTYNSVGVHLNAMNYFGDIVPESDFTSLRFKSTRPNLGVSFSRRFSPRFSARAAFAWGRITGDDLKSASLNEAENAPRYIRNLRFRNDIKELSAVITVDLFENRGNYLKRPDFSPYAFAGVAAFAHNPKAEDAQGNIVELQPLGTEGQYSPNRAALGYHEPYSKVQIAIPFGAGVRYKLDRNWDLGFEIGWRKTFTDYLDDVSTNYVQSAADIPTAKGLEMANRSTGPGHEFGNQRGDQTDKDWYIVAGFNLSYIIPTNVKSPKFR